MLLLKSDVYFYVTDCMKVGVSEPTEVHHHGDEFQQLGRRLSEIEQLLKTSRDSQVPLNDSVNNLVSELTKLGEKLQKLAHDRQTIESELHHKQHNFYLLSEIKNDLAHSVEKCQLVEDKCQLLQQIIDKNEEEIKRLKKKLQKKEHQLQSVQQEAQAMTEKLTKLQTELEEKHEEVKNLLKEKEELTRSYIAEKEEVKKLVQTTLSQGEMEVWQLDCSHVPSITLIWAITILVS